MLNKKEIIGRTTELNIFEDALNANSAEFIAVYGRRRVGKTYLIRKAFEKHTVFEFTGAYETTTSLQLKNFYNKFAMYAKPKAKTKMPKNWFEAFAMLSQFAEKKNKLKKKSVIFIDELPWIDNPKSNFVSALGYFWNSSISNLNNIILVVCGSATSWIVKKIFKNRGGLHNRVTKRIMLEPFTLSETKKFCEVKKLNLTNYQIAKMYMVFGGIPYYWKALKKGKSDVQHIDDICFKAQGLLKTEYNDLYFSLFKNAENHIKIIECLAQKPYGLTKEQISKISKIPKGGTLVKCINELVENGFVSRHQPIYNFKKNAVYRLIDFYTLFYLKFIKTAKTNTSFKTISSRNTYKIWCGYAFENICLLHIKQIKKALSIDGVYCQISSWRKSGDKNETGTQIDLLIDRADNIINLCEVKFYNKVLTINKKMHLAIRNKKWTFQKHVKENKAVHNILISTFGAEKNSYFFDQIDKEVVLDDLFL